MHSRRHLRAQLLMEQSLNSAGGGVANFSRWGGSEGVQNIFGGAHPLWLITICCMILLSFHLAMVHQWP